MIDKVTGKSVVLSIDVLGVLTPFACSTDVSVDETTEFIETSVSGSGKYATSLPTKNTWSASFGGVVAFNDPGPGNLTLADLKALQYAQSPLSISIKTANDAGTIYLTETGTAFISSCSYSGTFDGMANFTISLVGSGPLIKVFTTP